MQLSSKVTLTLTGLEARQTSELLAKRKDNNHDSFPLICNVAVRKAAHCPVSWLASHNIDRDLFCAGTC